MATTIDDLPDDILMLIAHKLDGDARLLPFVNRRMRDTLKPLVEELPPLQDEILKCGGEDVLEWYIDNCLPDTAEADFCLHIKVQQRIVELGSTRLLGRIAGIACDECPCCYERLIRIVINNCYKTENVQSLTWAINGRRVDINNLVQRVHDYLPLFKTGKVLDLLYTSSQAINGKRDNNLVKWVACHLMQETDIAEISRYARDVVGCCRPMCQDIKWDALVKRFYNGADIYAETRENIAGLTTTLAGIADDDAVVELLYDVCIKTYNGEGLAALCRRPSGKHRERILEDIIAAHGGAGAEWLAARATEIMGVAE